MNDKRIAKAVELISRYGGIDGEHHKQWLLDQVLRSLLDPTAYKKWVAERALGPNGEPDCYEEWDCGVAP